MSTLFEARMQEWAADFEQKGRREGEAFLLHRLLRKRFGELPEWVWPRLQQAQPEQLEHWGEQVLSADTLEAVFESD